MKKEDEFFIWEEKNLTEQLRKSENKETFVPKDFITNIEKKLPKKECNNIGKKKIISGIYKIINKVNGKYYIGSSCNIYQRWENHKARLNTNKHDNDYLQKSWNKHGKHNFEFTIIEEIPQENLLLVEQKYLNNLNKENSYNISFIAGKVEMNCEIRKRISISLQSFFNNGGRSSRHGCVLSDEQKKKLSIIKKGKPLPLETVQKAWEKTKDKTTYKLYNTETSETFTGTRSQFRKMYPNLHKSSVWRLFKSKMKSCKPWIVINF